MSSVLYYTLIALGGIVLLLGAAYGYFIYSPVPDEPVLSAAIQRQSIQTGGRTRTYPAYVPAKLPANPGLVLVLHGSKIDGNTIRKWTGYEFDEMADWHGFIVLYPDGYRNNWNDCRKDAPFEANKENVDDVGFLRALVERYERETGVDPTKVFAFGYSNGGQMAFRLAVEQPRFVTAIAAIAANVPVQAGNRCDWQGATPPVMLVSNTADDIMPYGGGEVKLLGTSYGRVLSAQASAEHFARRNGLMNSPVTGQPAGQAGASPLPITQRTWSSATPDQYGKPIVVWYTVTGGGHVVPQPRFRFPRVNGRTATNLDAPVEALRFFGLVGSM